MDEIDFETMPEFPVAPIEAYDGTVMPDEDDFIISSFDIGVIEDDINLGGKVVHAASTDSPPDKVTPKKNNEYKPKRFSQEANQNSELMRPLIVVPENLMDSVIGRLARRVSECLEFPEASVFMALLSSASSSVSTAYAVQYKTHTSVGLGLYTIIEHPPATKKSYLLGIGMHPYSVAIGAHNKAVGARCREILERAGEKSSMPLRAFNVATDATSAALDGRLAECSEGRFVIASAEQSALISLFPEAGSFASTNELILKGWAGEYVAGMRGGRKAYEGTAQGSITLIAQSGSSKRVLNASNGSGMAERFIFIAEPDYLGFRKHEGNYPTADDKADFEAASRACIDIYSKKILSFANSDGDRVIYDPENLIQLRASSVGYRAIRNKELDNEPRMGELKESGDMVMLSWLGKYETQVLKVAGVMHVFECLGSGCKVPEIIPDSLILNSMDLVDVLSDHIQQLLRDAGESGNEAEEDAIIDILSLKPMPRRALALKAKNRKPFKAMQANFKMANNRIDAMLKSGSLVISSTSGNIEIV